MERKCFNMKISKIEMGEFDRESYKNFEQYMNKDSTNNFYKEIYSNLKNNFENMEKASGLTGCANAIKSTLDNLKKYDQATQIAYGMTGYKSSYNDSVKTIKELCTLIQDKKTTQIIEKHLKYKELKSKNKLTKIFVVMFERIIKGSEYKRLKSRIKNYQNKISKNLNFYKVSTYYYTSITDFFAMCMEQLLRQTQQLIYSIMGTFVEAQDDKFADDQLIASNEFKIINSIDNIVEKDFVPIGDIVHPVGDRYNVGYYHLLAILDKFTEFEGKKKLRECFVKASNNKVTIRFFKVDISRVGLNKFKFTPKSPILIEVDASSVLTSSGEESGLWVKLIQKAYAVYCNKIQNNSKKITAKDMEYMCYS